MIYIDESNKTYEYVESDSIAEANEFATSGIYANAYVIVDDNDVDLIVYEVNGKLRDGNDTFKVLSATSNSIIAANDAINAAATALKSSNAGTTDDPTPVDATGTLNGSTYEETVSTACYSECCRCEICC